MILLIIIITNYTVCLLTSSMKVAVEPLTHCLDTSVHVYLCFNVLNLILIIGEVVFPSSDDLQRQIISFTIITTRNMCAVFQWTCLRSERFVRGETPRTLSVSKMARTNTMKIPASLFSMAHSLFSTPSVWEVSSLFMCVSGLQTSNIF